MMMNVVRFEIVKTAGKEAGGRGLEDMRVTMRKDPLWRTGGC
jgi:hypothetical protein